MKIREKASDTLHCTVLHYHVRGVEMALKPCRPLCSTDAGVSDDIGLKGLHGVVM